MTTRQQSKAGTRGFEGGILGLWWALAGAAAWTLAGPAGVAMTEDGNTLGRTMLSFGLGAILAGVLQGWLLRQTGLARDWIRAGIVMVALTAFWVFGAGTLVTEWGLFGIALLGPALGLVQWRLLRRRIPRAGWWVAATTVGWCLGGFLIGADSFDMDLATGGDPGNPAGWAVFGGAYGIVTGLAITWLMRQSSGGNAS
ncbi:MAG: hypothetical protein HKN20_13565 [Gemmatimonadetes bacterium]|nr:hypothetical protein [Gemmatimonadota bacterium]